VRFVNQSEVALWVELWVVWWQADEAHGWENVFNDGGDSTMFI
jgi:hypothetical protein